MAEASSRSGFLSVIGVSIGRCESPDGTRTGGGNASRRQFARLPIVRVLERFLAVILFGVLVYMLGLLITLLEVWHRPPASWRQSAVPMAAQAIGNPGNGVREYRASLPVMSGAPCVLVVHVARGLGLISSRMVCNGVACTEPMLKFDSEGVVVCTPDRVSR